jgi:hypothetical protein
MTVSDGGESRVMHEFWEVEMNPSQAVFVIYQNIG